jgi:hypothetical protein
MLGFRKTFFFNQYKVQIHLHSHGGVTGNFIISATGGRPSICKKLSGLYLSSGSTTLLSFYIDFAEVLSCYSGQIIRYSKNKECLVIKCLSINRLLADNELYSKQKTLILFENQPRNLFLETQKVVSEILTKKDLKTEGLLSDFTELGDLNHNL